MGEYGDLTERPHYHVALFGVPSCLWGKSRYGRLYVDCCVNCDLIRDTWKWGHVDVGTLTHHSATYIAGYVVKKMTSLDDERLDGRFPEFCRMSRRPGIAADATWELASDLLQYDVLEVDVPRALAYGRQLLPMGRYITTLLRERCGLGTEVPESVKAARKEEMRPLLEIAQKSPLPQGMRLSATVAEFYADETLQLELKDEFYKQRKVL